MRFAFFCVSGVAALSGDSYDVVTKRCSGLQDDLTTRLKVAQVSLANVTSFGAGQLQNYASEIERTSVAQESADTQRRSCSAREISGTQSAKDFSRDISLLTKDLDVAQQFNTLEQKKCADKHKELVTVVDNLRGAQSTLKTQHAATSFLEVHAMVQALFGDTPKATSADHVSGLPALIKLVDDLLTDTSDQLETSKTQCANALHTHKLLESDLIAQRAAAEQELETAQADVSQAKECKSTADTAYKQTSDLLNDLKTQQGQTQVSLKSQTTELQNQIIDFQNSLAGLAEVIKHLSNVDPAAQHLAMVPGVFLVQLHSTPSESATAFVAKRASELQSSTLSTLATQLAAASSEDFSGIKELIEDLISKLQSQAADDVDRSSQCQLEEDKQARTRIELDEKIDQLAAKQMESSAAIQQTQESLAGIASDLTTAHSKQSEAKAIRDQTKNANSAALADANNAMADLTSCLEIIERHNHLNELSGMFQTLLEETIELIQDTKQAESEAASEFNKSSKAYSLAQDKLNQRKVYADEKLAAEKSTLETTRKALAEQERMSNDAAKIEKATRANCNSVLTAAEKIKKTEDEVATLKQVASLLA